MDTAVKKAVRATDKKAQYDDSAKRLLGQKIILAHILVKTVDEFKGMNPKTVVSFIEGNPYISVVDEPGRYKILNRAIFYVCRLISSQKERDFKNTNYNDIKRVYSIWVCLNMDENSMNHIYLANDNVAGSYQWKGRLDLLNIVMIGLSKVLPEHDEEYELHRLLGALLSKELTVDEKLNILEGEYDIPAEEDIRKDVSIMCNLSQGIEDKGIAIGEARIINNMHDNGLTAEQIAAVTNRDIEYIEAIINKS